MILELDIPKTFTRTIQLESPSEAYEAILAHELKKNPRKDNLNFNSAYLRNGSNNRVVYYLETENNQSRRPGSSQALSQIQWPMSGYS